MFGFLFRAPAWQLVLQADSMTKFVLLILFSVSTFCIWIVICKLLMLQKQRQAMLLLRREIKRARSLDDLIALSKKNRETAGGRFLISALGELKDLLELESGAKLSASNLEYLHMLLDQSLDRVLSEEEEYLPVLSTSAAAAPLIGLFGTVWGLVHAFVNISQSKSADISVVAPGIAEALITTLAGLIVAIPALVFFHYFSNEFRKLELKLLNISDRFLNIVKSTFLKGA